MSYLIFLNSLKYAAPLMWSLVMVSTLMLLTLYDAETFLVSFLLLNIAVLGAVWALPNTAPLRMTRSPFVLLMFVFWGLAFVSVVFSKSAFTSYLFFCFLGVLPLSFIYIGLVRDKVRFFCVAFVGGGAVMALLALLCLLQYFVVPEMLPYGLTQYPFGNPNSLAGYLSLGFFCSYGLLVGAQDGAQSAGRKALFFGLSLLILSAIFTTGSRGGTLALLIGMGVFGFLLRGQVAKGWRIHGAFAALSVVVFVGLSIFAPAINGQTPLDVMLRSASGNMPLLWDRPAIWASTLAIAKDHMWSGIGVGTFFQVYPSYRGADTSTAGHMAHNDVLQFGAEMGVLGPLIFCSLLGYAVFRTVRVMKSLPLDDARRIWIAAPFCAAGALVLHTQISFHFYVLPTLFVLGGVLALWFFKLEAAQPSRFWQVTSGARAENILVKGCLSGLLLCCAFMLSMSQMSEVLVDSAKAKARAGDIQGFVERLNAADDFSFGRNARALALASTVSSGIVRSNGDKMSSDEVLKMLLRAERQLDQAHRQQPYMASVYHEKALVVELAQTYVPQQYAAHHKGAPLDVRQLMEAALHYNPLHANTRVKLVEVMMAAGDVEGAYAVLKDGLRWNYLGTKGLRFYNVLASMALERGDVEARDTALERVQSVYEQSERVKARDEALRRKLGFVYDWL